MLESRAVRPSIAALLCLTAVRCAPVVFVDPDADLKAQLVIDEAQRLLVDGDPRSYFFVRIRGREGADLVRLSALGADGSFALPLEQATDEECGNGQRCLAIALGPGLPEGLVTLELDAPDIGHRHAAPIMERRLSGYALAVEPLERNERVRVQVVDPIRIAFPTTELVDGRFEREIFPRTFDTIWRSGACGDPFDATDPRWTKAATLPVTIPTTFSEGGDPSVCVAVRPTKPAGGDAVRATTVNARAVITTFDHTYVPPTEVSPLVFLPIFNLELPSEARCTEAEALVSAAIREAAVEIASDGDEGSPILELAPLDIADRDGEPCRQHDDPRFAPDVLFDRIRAEVETAFGPSRRVRVVIVYVTNLRIEMPAALAGRFASLRNLFDFAPTLRDFVIAIAPDEAHDGLDTEETLPWLATEEPTFRASIRNLLASSWPFKTMIHSPNTIVPLVDQDDAGRFQYYRTCQATTAALFPLGEPLEGTTVLIPPATGPAYQVDLPDQTLEPALEYTAPIVGLRWQGCEALCDRPPPLTPPGVQTAWLLLEGC